MILLREALEGKKIIIYGAGKIGKRIFQSLGHFDYKPEFFWDKNAGILAAATPIPVHHTDFTIIPHKSRKNYVVIVTVFAKAVNEQICQELFDLGYDVISISKETTDNLNRYIGQHRGLVFPKIGLLITDKCNLACKGCNHLRFRNERKGYTEIAAPILIADLKKILEAVDFIGQITVVGGEPFLHNDLYQILRDVLLLSKIDKIEVITNGTVIPINRNVFEVLAHERITVEISGYKELPNKLKLSTERFISELKRYNVNYNYQDTLTWFDFGDFIDREYLRSQLKDIYDSCCFVSNDLFDGKLHKCSRSVFANQLSLIPDYPEDYVNVRSSKDLKSDLIKFLKMTYPSVCLHCNGTSTKTIEAGCQ